MSLLAAPSRLSADRDLRGHIGEYPKSASQEFGYMAADAARVVHPISAASPPWSALVIALLFLSAASPTIFASAEQRVASDDFQILDDLDAVLSMDRAIKSDASDG